MERDLRRTLGELAGQVRAVDDLAGTAMALGVRMRRRRRLAVVSSVTAVVLALSAVPFALRGPAAPQQTLGTAAPSPGGNVVSEAAPRILAEGWVLTGINGWVLDRKANRYTKLEAKAALPQYLAAPAGDLAAIVTLDEDANQYVFDFITTASVPQRTVKLNASGPFQWSPQGDRLLVKVVSGKASRAGISMGFATIDAATGEVTKHPIDLSRYDCSQCEFVWSRDGREVAVAVADRRGGEAHEHVWSVQFFDAQTGRPTRSIALRAMFSGPFSWSPNGQWVIARPDGLSHDVQLIDTRTMEAKPFWHDAVFVTDNLLLAIEDRAVVVLRRDGSTVERYELGGEFTAPGGTATFGPPTP